MPDSQTPDALCSFFFAGYACDQRLFFFKTNVVGSLWLPTGKAWMPCSIFGAVTVASWLQVENNS
jgi:hypothetical protein